MPEISFSSIRQADPKVLYVGGAALVLIGTLAAGRAINGKWTAYLAPGVLLAPLAVGSIYWWRTATSSSSNSQPSPPPPPTVANAHNAGTQTLQTMPPPQQSTNPPPSTPSSSTDSNAGSSTNPPPSTQQPDGDPQIERLLRTVNDIGPKTAAEFTLSVNDVERVFSHLSATQRIEVLRGLLARCSGTDTAPRVFLRQHFVNPDNQGDFAALFATSFDGQYLLDIIVDDRQAVQSLLAAAAVRNKTEAVVRHVSYEVMPIFLGHADLLGSIDLSSRMDTWVRQNGIQGGQLTDPVIDQLVHYARRNNRNARTVLTQLWNRNDFSGAKKATAAERILAGQTVEFLKRVWNDCGADKRALKTALVAEVQKLAVENPQATKAAIFAYGNTDLELSLLEHDAAFWSQHLTLDWCARVVFSAYDTRATRSARQYNAFRDIVGLQVRQEQTLQPYFSDIRHNNQGIILRLCRCLGKFDYDQSTFVIRDPDRGLLNHNDLIALPAIVKLFVDKGAAFSGDSVRSVVSPTQAQEATGNGKGYEIFFAMLAKGEIRLPRESLHLSVEQLTSPEYGAFASELLGWSEGWSSKTDKQETAKQACRFMLAMAKSIGEVTYFGVEPFELDSITPKQITKITQWMISKWITEKHQREVWTDHETGRAVSKLQVVIQAVSDQLPASDRQEFCNQIARVLPVETCLRVLPKDAAFALCQKAQPWQQIYGSVIYKFSAREQRQILTVLRTHFEQSGALNETSLPKTFPKLTDELSNKLYGMCTLVMTKEQLSTLAGWEDAPQWIGSVVVTHLESGNPPTAKEINNASREYQGAPLLRLCQDSDRTLETVVGVLGKPSFLKGRDEALRNLGKLIVTQEKFSTLAKGIHVVWRATNRRGVKRNDVFAKQLEPLLHEIQEALPNEYPKLVRELLQYPKLIQDWVRRIGESRKEYSACHLECLQVALGEWTKEENTNKTGEKTVESKKQSENSIRVLKALAGLAELPDSRQLVFQQKWQEFTTAAGHWAGEIGKVKQGAYPETLIHNFLRLESCWPAEVVQHIPQKTWSKLVELHQKETPYYLMRSLPSVAGKLNDSQRSKEIGQLFFQLICVHRDDEAWTDIISEVNPHDTRAPASFENGLRVAIARSLGTNAIGATAFIAGIIEAAQTELKKQDIKVQKCARRAVRRVLGQLNQATNKTELTRSASLETSGAVAVPDVKQLANALKNQRKTLESLAQEAKSQK